jgi:hypothetical protein
MPDDHRQQRPKAFPRSLGSWFKASSRWMPVIALGGAVIGCPGSLEEPGRFAPPCDPPKLLELHCSGSICHSSKATFPRAVHPDLISEGVAIRIVDVDAQYEGVRDDTNCPMPPEKIVDTAMPMQSLIIKKLTDTQECGEPMPGTGLELPEQDLACLLDWANNLAAGAGGAVGGGGAPSTGGAPSGGGAGGSDAGGGGAPAGGGGAGGGL